MEGSTPKQPTENYVENNHLSQPQIPQNDVSKEIAELKRQVGVPLAHMIRPKALNDFIGQEKLLGEGAPLRNIIKSDLIPSFLLWGPPGCGKTTLGRIIAKSTSCKFVELSGASSGAKDLKQVFTQAENHKKLTQQRTILFIDEIHRYNKAVQDLLLPVVEKGVCTVIGATTENPSFSLNNALLSRMQTFVMEAFSNEAIVRILNRALFEVNRARKLLYDLPYMTLEKDSFEYIAGLCMGDSRAALNVLETVNAYLSADRFEEKSDDGAAVNVTVDDLKKILSLETFTRCTTRTVMRITISLARSINLFEGQMPMLLCSTWSKCCLVGRILCLF